MFYVNFNSEIIYPPPYLQEVWHYKHANTKLIGRASSGFDRQSVLWNTNISEEVDIFNSTVLDILRNFVPHKLLVCDNKDTAWFTTRK